LFSFAKTEEKPEEKMSAEQEKEKEEIVRIPSSPYQSVGALGIQTSKSQIEWDTCRDRFQSKTDAKKVESFLFYHEAGRGDNVINFMRTFEAACGCPHDQGINFKKTSNKNVLWVGLSEWWNYRVRRSLLTALLRCGQSFTEDTGKGFVKALNSQYYLSGTTTAVEAFLSGKTACKMKKNYGFGGWHNFFNGKTKDQIDKCLVKLKRRKEGVPPEPVEGEANSQAIKPEEV
jgi:hypothetical protein